ncbi:MAG: HAD family hydrolase [Spirochaetes bacterium]|nr:HAD family hydrolase [Spirochaetota bacterium]
MNHIALLSDLDGTLLDTLHDIASSMNAALEQNGFPVHPVESYKRFIGGGVGELARRVLPDGEDDAALVNKMSMEMRSEYALRWRDKTRLYPGIAMMLDCLCEQNIRLAVLSNKPDDFTRLICDHFLAPWNFDVIRGASDAYPKKPDPTTALMIAAEMEVKPRRFIYLGDSGTDMQTAVAAGMYPVGVLWGFREADELLGGGAKVLLHSPEGIKKLFFK